MVSGVTNNRQALGQIWNLQDLSEACSGYQILLQGDVDHDLPLEPEVLDKIDWIAFSTAAGIYSAPQRSGQRGGVCRQAHPGLKARGHPERRRGQAGGLVRGAWRVNQTGAYAS